MDSTLTLRNPQVASTNRLVREIHAIRKLLMRRSKLRGKLPSGMLVEIQEMLLWGGYLELEIRERLGMAKPNDRQSTWKGFVDVKLTEQEKENFTQWDVHDNDLFLLLAEAVVAGHKQSLTWNKQNETYVFSFTGNEGAGKHEGYTLSAFAGDWYIALRVLLYKHHVLLEGDWSKAKDRPTENIG